MGFVVIRFNPNATNFDLSLVFRMIMKQIIPQPHITPSTMKII